MLEKSASQAFKIKYALRTEKQCATTEADRFGGDIANWPGEGDSFPAESDTDFQQGIEFYTDASMNGTQFNGFKQRTAELPTISGLAVKGYVQGLERVLLAGLGYAPVDGPKPIEASPGFFRHFFVVPPQGRNQRPYSAEEKAAIGDDYDEGDIVNAYICVSQALGPYARHARNVILKDFEIACSAKSVLQITASGPAERIEREDDKASVANWSTAPDSWPENAFQLSDFKIFIGPSNGPEPSEAHSATEFSLKISHGLSDDNVPTGTSNNGLSRAEPMPSGKSTITLDMTIYLHDKTLYEDWLNKESKLQCKLVAQRGKYRFAILLPRLQLAQAQPNFDGAGSTALSFEVAWPCDEAEQAAAVNSFPSERGGMAWPQASVLGIVATSKENRNPMRDMEITGEA
ncbi:MAG: hypothetical protein LBC64_01895 [Fibromonadaceae bacterium]|jgi:hypothetical protein|nr:hypothetical protein [Fibromonadaceae bacterium]